MSSEPLLTVTSSGLFCPKGNFFIDPHRPVDSALITHAHGDHAYAGSHRYIAHHWSVPVLHHRLGTTTVVGKAFHEPFSMGDVEVTLFPAGHCPGSAQIRVSDGQSTWVVSGDYKVEDDGLSAPFEAVPCDVFISECTFGLPLFRWRPQLEIFDEIIDWWGQNAARGECSLLFAYSLGKAQRILHGIGHRLALPGEIFVHSAIDGVNKALMSAGCVLPSYPRPLIDVENNRYRAALVLAPPSLLEGSWTKRFAPARAASASGWMALKGIRRRRGIEKGFVLSDHADWPGLISAIKQTHCSRVLLTHGSSRALERYLNEEHGLRAEPLHHNSSPSQGL
jgi:putative mRNA 3-end processing factor